MNAHAYTPAELEGIARRLGGAGRAGDGWACRCPAHEDGTPSLSLSLGEGGRLLWHCHAGCHQTAVLDGLRAAGVLLNGDARPNGHDIRKPQIVAAYEYADEAGRPLFRILRLAGKRFVQERREAGRWIGGKGAMKGVRRVLFRLPVVLAADEVVFVEGEKDSINLAAAGLCGTTSPQGARFWRDELAAPLEGKRVVVLPDNDAVGREHARKVAAAARRHGATSVKVVELDGLAEHGDVSDWLKAGHTADELRALIARAPEWHPAGDPAAPFDLSHDGLALGLGEAWADRARHVHLWGRWLFWTGTRWELDEQLSHMTRARGYLRRRADELAKAAAAGKVPGLDADKAGAIGRTLRSAQTVAHVVGLARSNERQAATVAMWDADPRALGTPGGIVDLRTGDLRPADPLAYITKQTAVAPAPPGSPCTLWQAFLERIFRHDPELIPYMQRVLGYALTGLTTEHTLLFAWGQGANGKGTLFNLMSWLLGDYAAVAPTDLLLVTQGDRHPTDLAMLRGVRLVTAQELGPGRAWDEPKLKSLTGGDEITARFMRQDFFTYMPQFFLVVAGNHKPSLKRVDEAIRRRLRLVPFLQVIPLEERDGDLPEKLKAEGPAILRWAIDGCLAWQKQGLAPPASVREASEDYLAGEDLLGQWIEERCVVSATIALTATAALFADWSEWSAANGGPGWGVTTFSKALDERGFVRGKSGDTRGFRGIALRPKSASDPGPDPAPGWEGDA